MTEQNFSNNQKPTNRLETWEQIPKTKWEGLPKKEVITLHFNTNQTLVKSKPLQVLDNIRKRIDNQIQQISPIDNIYNIVTHPDILRISYSKVKRNKGKLTPGSDPTITADTIAEKQIQELSKRLRNGTFKWKPVRRILIEKPGKREKRPLGLPDFDDKIVQGAILLILEAAYEGEFEKYNCNFGFRANKDTNGAIEKIKMEARHYQYAIEGDIKGAYDNVDHKKLLNILKQRFKDYKFLQLIERGLENGYMLDFITYETLLGTPQGSICSPILFNIYMHEFDKYVINEWKKKTESPTKPNESNAEYEKIRSRKKAAQLKLKNFQQMNRDLEQMNIGQFCMIAMQSKLINTTLQNNPSFVELRKYYNSLSPDAKIRGKMDKQYKLRETILQNITEEHKEILRKEFEIQQKKIILENKIKQQQLPSLDSKKLQKKITYVRYADDWIIFVRGTNEDAEKIKNKASTFLQNHLGLTLSQEKTKITNLYKEKARFLGFELFYQRNKLVKRVLKNETQTTQRFGNMTIQPDGLRLEARFIQKKYMDKDGNPREIGFLTVLKDHEIITKYNQFMMGIGNYYIRQISYPSIIGRWMYILYYSCIKTLATKHKTSTKKIIQKYGYLDISIPNTNSKKPRATDLRITSKYIHNQETKYATLYNYKEIMFLLLKLKDKYLEEKFKKLPHNFVREADMLALHKVNLRTSFKETSFCAICGKKEKSLHNHHIRHLKKKNGRYEGYRGFDKIVASLGRKQIPVCSECHHKIHDGKYDSTSLQDIYDIRLVAPEALLSFRTPKQNPQPSEPTSKNEILINEESKTYLNKELRNYLTSKKI